jgi:integrase
MAGVEKRTGRDGKPYYRARYVRPDGRKGTVLGTDGKAIKYPTKVTAIKAARKAEDEADAAAGRGRWVPPELSRTTLYQFVYGADGEDGWLEEATADLADSSKANYGHHLSHILPTFGATPLAEIDSQAIDAWERAEKAAGAASSARTYRATLHTILTDAVAAGHVATNPATRRRGRGRKSGRGGTAGRKPQKAITNAVGALLLGERMSLLSGRDDEFVCTVLQLYATLRWGETVGLDAQYVGQESIAVEWQLYELGRSGKFVRCAPKDDSYRTIDIPAWLGQLLRGHIARAAPAACGCHGQRYVFRGNEVRAGYRLKEVAELAGVSIGTVSNVFNRPERVAAATRERVDKAAAELGAEAGGTRYAAHWRRSGHSSALWTPAATGYFPAKAPYPRRPVLVRGEPVPGIPVRGRGAEGRADASWLPIRQGLTRHGMRHSGKTLMEEIGTPKVLMDDRMGHIDSSVSARYSHVTDVMRRRLMDDLTEQWCASLDARLAMHPRSPVPVLDRLLLERAETR